MKVLFSLVLLLCYCSRAAKATCDIVTNTDFDDEALLLQEFSGSNPVLEIFKIHRVKIWKANFRRCRICVERDAVGGIETTYILNDGTMRTVCHGKRDRNNDLKLDATLGQDEFPTKMVVRTGDDRAYKVTLSTSKRALSGVGGSGSPRTNQKTFQESGQVIIAFKGKVAGDGIMGDFTRPVFNTQPDGETAFKVEIIGDVEYTEVMNTGFAEPVNSADGKVTVDNSDPAATEPATQTLTLEQEFRKSETNTVGLTTSASFGVSTTVSVGASIRGVFEVGASTTVSVGFGFERSFVTSEAFEEINTRSIISPVTAQAGTITTGIIYIRTVEYVLEWSAPVRIFRLKDPENPEEGTLTGTLDGEQAVDAQLVIEVQDFRDDDGDSSTTSVPVPTSAPDNSGGGGGGGGPNCFSAKSTVEVTGKGILPISKLTIGDFVHVGNGDFSQVYSFGHYDTQSKTDFLQIHAKGLLEPIEITSAHMLYVNDVALRADQVQIGDMLGKHKVWNITTMTRAGRFAPLTNSGDIVISGVRASCYVAFLDGLPPRFMNTITHVVLGARRLKCYANFNLCENEQYTDEEGIADWLYPSLSFLTDLEGYQGIIQAGVGLLALPVINLSFIVEPKMVSISSVGTMIGSLFAFSWA